VVQRGDPHITGTVNHEINVRRFARVMVSASRDSEVVISADDNQSEVVIGADDFQLMSSLVRTTFN